MPNRLALETSPYLRQHADNPVDWYPWGDEALARARAEGKPILLSIGYSACHWCHVMAHESFEDDGTAQAMNALFVNIKVDREERPDLDRLYQLAHQALVRRGGGWPLTVFLTPDDLMPFFAGTYFPREPRYGMPSFVQVMQHVRGWFDQKPTDVREQNAALRAFLDQFLDPRAGRGEARERAPIGRALARYEQLFDIRHGGFGQAPKFPHTGDLELIGHEAMRETSETRRAQRWQLVEHTLACMAAGGIHDQLGGGFCRYSVDARWAIPHFEKMLYDNALLLPLYARAWQVTRRESFRQTALGIVAWLDREMAAPGGGWYAALDADSEGREGRYYLWQRDEVRDLLPKFEWDVVRRYYGFDLPPNFEDEAWNPCVVRSVPQVAIDVGLTEAESMRLLDRARATLLAHRASRVRPATDTKVLTAWNALMAAGLARAGRMLGDASLVTRAESGLSAIQQHVWREKRLYASFQGGVARHNAYLDDYAFTLDAAIEVLRSRWSAGLLQFAMLLAESLLQRFEDRPNGGFFFTGHDHEQLIARAKSYADEALPSGNGVAVRGLLRLGRLIGETRYLDAAQRALDAGWGAMNDAPHGCATMLLALSEALQPPLEVVIRLSPSAPAAPWAHAAEQLRAREIAVYLVSPDARDLPGLLAERRLSRGGTAYVCEGTACLAPIFSPEELTTLLSGASKR